MKHKKTKETATWLAPTQRRVWRARPLTRLCIVLET